MAHLHLTLTLGLLETSNFACAKFHANEINLLFCTHLHYSVDLAQVLVNTGTGKWPEPSGVRAAGILRYENTPPRVVLARDLKIEWLNGWTLWIVLLCSFFFLCSSKSIEAFDAYNNHGPIKLDRL